MLAKYSSCAPKLQLERRSLGADRLLSKEAELNTCQNIMHLPVDYQALGKAILAQYPAPYTLIGMLETCFEKTAGRPMRTEAALIKTFRPMGKCGWEENNVISETRRNDGFLVRHISTE